MSSILKALKKLELEERHGKISSFWPPHPRLLSQVGRITRIIHLTPVAPLLLATLCLAAGGGGYYYLIKRHDQESIPASINRQEVVHPARAAVTDQSAVVRTQDTHRKASPRPSSFQESRVPDDNAPSRNFSMVTGDIPARESKRRREAPPDSPLPVPEPLHFAPEALHAEPYAGPADCFSDEEFFTDYDYEPIPPHFDDSNLILQAITWDPDPDRRFTAINNKIAHMGETVDGYLVVHIGQEHVVLEKDNENRELRFRIR